MLGFWHSHSSNSTGRPLLWTNPLPEWEKEFIKFVCDLLILTANQTWFFSLPSCRQCTLLEVADSTRRRCLDCWKIWRSKGRRCWSCSTWWNGLITLWLKEERNGGREGRKEKKDTEFAKNDVMNNKERKVLLLSCLGCFKKKSCLGLLYLMRLLAIGERWEKFQG